MELKLLMVDGDGGHAALAQRIEDAIAGLGCTLNRCGVPSSMAEMYELPILSLPDGTSFRGAKGAELFCRRVEAGLPWGWETREDAPGGLAKFAKALDILLRHGNPADPVLCDRDRLTVRIDPDSVPARDKARLAELGFLPEGVEAPDAEGSVSFRYGLA